MTSEFMQPAPRWIILPGDPPALRRELAQLLYGEGPVDEPPLPPDPEDHR